MTTYRPRWHVVSYDVGDSASTSLVEGISSSDTSFEVTSILGFPDQFPFDITVDDGPAAEDMTVKAGLGADWTVTRGITPGRPAIIHEQGTAVKRLGGETWDGFVFDYDWPEGLAYATDQVNRLSKPLITISVKIVNTSNGWLTVKLGSTHHVSLTSEGVGAGWNGMVRVLGYATDWDAGVMEVFTEWLG
jgi:hypothetical protein